MVIACKEIREHIDDDEDGMIVGSRGNWSGDPSSLDGGLCPPLEAVT